MTFQSSYKFPFHKDIPDVGSSNGTEKRKKRHSEAELERHEDYEGVNRG